ncbi:hypothetical protein Plhal304r1_c025g0083911 [Plasmopara halstedii]
MTKLDTSQDLDHAACSHLTRTSGKLPAASRWCPESGRHVAAVLSADRPQRLAAQEFMERDIAYANRRVSTSSRSFKNDVA